MELLELVLMRTFMKLFTDHYKSHYKTHEAISPAYSTLAAVCNNWWQTMKGWSESATRHWLKHRIFRAAKRKLSLSLDAYVQTKLQRLTSNSFLNEQTDCMQFIG